MGYVFKMILQLIEVKAPQNIREKQILSWPSLGTGLFFLVPLQEQAHEEQGSVGG